jgi:hypothetical protein
MLILVNFLACLLVSKSDVSLVRKKELANCHWLCLRGLAAFIAIVVWSSGLSAEYAKAVVRI